MAKRKPKRGRPFGTATTGSSTTPLVSYRVSAAQDVELVGEAARLGITRNEVAKRRAFPIA